MYSGRVLNRLAMSLLISFGLSAPSASAVPVSELPDLPTGVAGNPHPMPAPGAATNFTAGNGSMSITEFSNGVRQKTQNGSTMTKWPDGAVRIQRPDGSVTWKYDNPNVVGRVRSNDGTRITQYRGGTQYISQPDPSGLGSRGRVIAPDGTTINIPAPAPLFTQSTLPFPDAPATPPPAAEVASTAPDDEGGYVDPGFDPLVLSTLLGGSSASDPDPDPGLIDDLGSALGSPATSCPPMGGVDCAPSACPGM